MQEEEGAAEGGRDYVAEMKELMSYASIDTSVVLRRLKLNEEDVLGLYVVGSRLWGSATYSSDWDFIVVLKKWPEGRSSLHSGDIDASAIDKEEFFKRVYFYLIIFLMLTR